MSEMCSEYRAEMLPGYALSALEAAEQARTEEHLAGCPDCRQEAAQMAEALHAALGQAVPRAAPSPLLRTQFLARLAVELGPVAARTVPGQPATAKPPLIQAGRQAPPPAAPGIKRSVGMPVYRWLGAAAAVPTALALVFGVMAFNMRHQIEDEHARVLAMAFQSPHVAMPLQGPGAAEGARGEMIKAGNGKTGLLIVSGLPVPAPGMNYRCWLRRSGQWSQCGTLRADASGIAMMIFDRNMGLDLADHVAITIEHGNQLPARPSAQMVFGTTL